jgi:hypothetical protein
VASIPLDYVQRKRETPIWMLESAFRCRRCSRLGYRLPVYLVKLTKEREIPASGTTRPSYEAQLIIVMV